MTDRDELVEQAARTMYEAEPDNLKFQHTPTWDDLARPDLGDGYRRRASALVDDGWRPALHGPPHRGGSGWYEVIHPAHATTHVAYVYEDGSIYFPEGVQVLDRHEFAFAAARGEVFRLVRAESREDVDD